MNKQLLGEIADFLDECREFLVDCDDGLAGEISAKDRISGRIWKAAGEIPSAVLLARTLEKRAE